MIAIIPTSSNSNPAGVTRLMEVQRSLDRKDALPSLIGCNILCVSYIWISANPFLSISQSKGYRNGNPFQRYVGFCENDHKTMFQMFLVLKTSSHSSLSLRVKL